MAAEKNEIRRLQFEAAGCTNELLEISEDISRYVIPAYSQPDIFMLQSAIQSERLSRLNARLENIRTELKERSASSGAVSDTDDPQLAEVRRSAAVTLQIIDQSLAVSSEKLILLKEMQISLTQAEENLKAAKKLEDTAQVLKLKEGLAKLSGK